VDHYLKQLEGLLAEPPEAVVERERTAFDKLLRACNNRLVLFGAGNFGRRALKSLRGSSIEPLAFSDNGDSKWGTKAEGVPIIAPQDAARRYGDSALFVVTIWSLGHSYLDTRIQLETLGCRNVVPSSTLRWKYSEQLLPDFSQDLPHKVYDRKDEVRAAANLWADDYSRREYLNQIRWRALGDLAALGPPDREESYFLDTLYDIQPGEIFVDCGAYDGDTAKQVVARSREFAQIVAVEADPATFQRLNQWIGRTEDDVAPRIAPYNVAVGATQEKLRFKATGTEGACLARDGDTVVDCVPIEDLMGENAPTFIKMDIEGAEMKALEGARHVIQKHHPILSICVYHRQSDVWDIPLFIRSLWENYQFFLRPHDVDGWQLVCYAIPPHRLRSPV